MTYTVITKYDETGKMVSQTLVAEIKPPGINWPLWVLLIVLGVRFYVTYN